MAEVLDPAPLFALIAKQVPGDLLGNILVVGSLAAAYHFRDKLAGSGVNTKDADFVIYPAGAIAECQAIAERLLDIGWRRHRDCYPQPQPDPVGELRAIRLYPPDIDLYFIELLGFPDARQSELKTWIPLELSGGWYGLPVFRYMGLTRFSLQCASEGLHYAAPLMMALANMLSHPEIGTATMSEPIGGRMLRRSAKDLGRVLGLAWLSDPDEIETWPDRWEPALREIFPTECDQLARAAGSGLRALLDDEDVLDEARHALNVGLLAGRNPTNEQLKAIGKQLIGYAIDPLARRFT